MLLETSKKELNLGNVVYVVKYVVNPEHVEKNDWENSSIYTWLGIQNIWPSHIQLLHQLVKYQKLFSKFQI